MSARPTILFAQELGSGLGHITRLATIANNFSNDHLVFVARDPTACRAQLAKLLARDVACLPSPPVQSSTSHRPERSMADILAGLGFADATALATRHDHWQGILRDVQPDLIFSDFAPSLRIATAGMVPHIVVGNGFVVPPDIAPMPMLRDEADASNIAGAAAIEAAILNAVNRVRAGTDRASFARLASLLHGDASFALSLPLLDPYRAYRHEPLMPPLGIGDVDTGPSVMSRRGPHIFCYLDADAMAINPILTALNGLDRPSHIFVRNIDPNELARHCAPQVGIHREPANLRTLLPHTRLVVHSGTLGTAEIALLAGTPQLQFPDTLERELTAQALIDEGVCTAVEPRSQMDAGALRDLMIAMLDDRALHDRAMASARAARFSTEPSLHAIIAAAKHLLAVTASRRSAN